MFLRPLYRDRRELMQGGSTRSDEHAGGIKQAAEMRPGGGSTLDRVEGACAARGDRFRRKSRRRGPSPTGKIARKSPASPVAMISGAIASDIVSHAMRSSSTSRVAGV